MAIHEQGKQVVVDLIVKLESQIIVDPQMEQLLKFRKFNVFNEQRIHKKGDRNLWII